MSAAPALPALMVAPNGARLGHDDHPHLPVTLPEIVNTARACHLAGADGLHLHLRDPSGAHILDAALYTEALAELARAVPAMKVQITTESVGKYQPAFQRRLAVATNAAMVSVALREITADGEIDAARAMHRRCQERGVGLQYILYAADELLTLGHLLGQTAFCAPDLQVLFVLGGHDGKDAAPAMLSGFIDQMAQSGITPDWMVCAFGPPETDCLLAAAAAGGKLRVGFENSRFQRNGKIARNNAERVAEIRGLLSSQQADIVAAGRR